MKKKKKEEKEEPEFIEPKRSYVAVFGYGSLVAPHEMEIRTTKNRPKPFYANLHGFSRNWLVTSTWGLGTEHYLGIDFAPVMSVVNGVVFYVHEFGLEALDRREALYHRQRIDGHVTNRDGVKIEGPIYTYIPTTFVVEQAIRRLKEGSAYISNRYYTIVTEAFKAAGQLEEFKQSTPIPDGMVVRSARPPREKWVEGGDGFVRPFNNASFHMASAFTSSGPTEA